MRNTNPVVVLVLSIALVLLTAVSASAQGGFHGGSVAPRGVPASVTSFGFGGHPGFHGIAPSVTSFGFGGHAGFRGVPPSVTSLGFGAPFHTHNRPFVVTRRHRFNGFGSPFFGGYSVPYAYPYLYPFYPGDSASDYVDDPPSAEGQRDDDARQQLDDDYRTELNSQRYQRSEPSAEPVTAQPSTVLIFKDGHQLEVENYAIVGTTLYDFSDGRSKKVQLADLDLDATLKENDQRGVEFQLPAGTKLD